VARQAGLTATMTYGVPEVITYIVEEAGRPLRTANRAIDSLPDLPQVFNKSKWRGNADRLVGKILSRLRKQRASRISKR
jgi:hypothetical protein